MAEHEGWKVKTGLFTSCYVVSSACYVTASSVRPRLPGLAVRLRRFCRFVGLVRLSILGPVGVCWCLFGVLVDVIRSKLPPAAQLGANVGQEGLGLHFKRALGSTSHDVRMYPACGADGGSLDLAVGGIKCRTQPPARHDTRTHNGRRRAAEKTRRTKVSQASKRHKRPSARRSLRTPSRVHVQV